MSRLSMLLETSHPKQPTWLPPTNRTNLSDHSVQLNFPHRLFVPEHYEPGYAYPLVVWLHSDASSELELDTVMASLSLRNYIGIAPRANIKSRGNQQRYRWGVSSTDCALAEDLVWDCVQQCMETLSVHPDRVFLAGFGGGATMAQWIGLKYARQIAGVVSLSGRFPKTSRVLSNWKQARELKVLFSQNKSSKLCSEDELVYAVKTAHQSGLDYQFVQFQQNQYECEMSDPDSLDVEMLAVANRYMMGIVTGCPLNLSPETTCDNEYAEFGAN